MTPIRFARRVDDVSALIAQQRQHLRLLIDRTGGALGQLHGHAQEADRLADLMQRRVNDLRRDVTGFPAPTPAPASMPTPAPSLKVCDKSATNHDGTWYCIRPAGHTDYCNFAALNSGAE